MTHTRVDLSRSGFTALVAVTVLAAGTIVGMSEAHADDGPSRPPGTEATATAPVKVDSNDPDLKTTDGATLAESKVLDIAQVVEDLGGEERREDTNADIKFSLQAEVLFGKDSAKLSGQANGRIAAIAAEIEKNSPSKVRVFGFTDNLGSYEHGKVLSKQRADAVNKVLGEQLNAAGITYEVRGYSEDYPIADNDTEEGRKKNRRVEISFPRAEGS